jgi:hypothetical protein
MAKLKVLRISAAAAVVILSGTDRDWLKRPGFLCVSDHQHHMELLWWSFLCSARLAAGRTAADGGAALAVSLLRFVCQLPHCWRFVGPS